jgi:hypothetical protein
MCQMSVNTMKHSQTFKIFATPRRREFLLDLSRA